MRQSALYLLGLDIIPHIPAMPWRILKGPNYSSLVASKFYKYLGNCHISFYHMHTLHLDILFAQGLFFWEII